MKDKKKHIRQRPDDKYPEPEVPADGAWAGMKDMLDKGMPLPDSGPSSGSFNFNWLKATKLLSIAAFTCTGLAYFIAKKNPVDFPNKTKPETAKLIRTEGILAPNESATGKSSKSQKETTKATSASKAVSNNSIEKPIVHKLNSDPSVSTIHNELNSEPGSKESDRTSRKKSGTGSDKSKNALVVRPATALERNLTEGANTGSGDKLRPSYNTISQKKTSSLPNKDQFGASNVITREALQTNGPIAGSQLAKGGSSETKGERQGKSRRTNPLTNNSLPSESRLETTPEKHLSIVSMLVGKTAFPPNNLNQILKTIKVQSIGIVFKPQQNIAKRNILKNIHGGFIWNLNAPFSGYDWYFRGTNNTTFKESGISNEFYKVLFPGLWISKTLKGGDEIVVKVKPYNQYPGTSKRPDSTKVRESDTTSNYYTITRNLLKSSGLNLAIQYNHAITNRWSVGIGANIQWQQKGLLSNEVKSSKRNTVVDYIPFGSLTQSADTTKYLKPCFVATNVELLYNWRKFQLGIGLGMPVTSMVGSRYRSLRPISGQVTFRWKLK